MFIALKYGAAAMAGATASYVFLKQEHELALSVARSDAVDRRAARALGHTKPNSNALDDATMRFHHTGVCT